MSFQIGPYVDGILAGKKFSCSYRRVPTQASVAYWWSDLSMSPGFPPPNYYAATPLASALLSGGDGIPTGFTTGSSKWLTEASLTTATANLVGQYTLCDYLMYYPFVDLDDTSPQSLTNVNSLQRYTSGVGIMPMMVCQGATVGNGSFTFTYVDQNNDTITSPTNYYATTTGNIGAVLTSEPATTTTAGPWLSLGPTTTGIKRIVSLTNIVSNGGGLGCIVLVKPLLDIPLREANTESELTMVSMRSGPIRVYDDAYLNFICNTAGTYAAGLLTGRLDFTWS